MQRCKRLAHSVVVLAAAGVGALPARADPLQAPDCKAALVALQAQEAAAPQAAPGAAPPASLQAARRRAAHACLGARADEQKPPQAPQVVAPIAVPPAAIAVPPAAAALPPSNATSIAIPANRPPPIVTGCDLLGCWASDGTRLNRAGPGLLFGPRGFCSQTGPTALNCP